MSQQLIPVSLIDNNPYQPASRAAVPAEVAEQFARSFLENGMLQAPLVRGCGPATKRRFQIADGQGGCKAYRQKQTKAENQLVAVPAGAGEDDEDDD